MMARDKSLFDLMRVENFTTLEMFYDRANRRLLMRGIREWDNSVRWNKYMKDFTLDDILAQDYKAVGTAELVAAFERFGFDEKLKHIEKLLEEGGHHGIEFYYNLEKNIRVMYCKHVNSIGITNRRHAIRSGGIRRHELDCPDMEVLIDGLNLSRSMSYKNAIAGLPYGGSKILVQSTPVELEDEDTCGFLAFIIDKARSFTGPDMGFSPEFSDILREKFTNAITGGLKSPIGATGRPTAYGVYLAIKEACRFVYGTGVGGKTIAIQGLGEVGLPLATYLLKDGVKLMVTDLDKSKVKALQKEWNTDLVESVNPEDIYTVAADIFCPCAMGSIIDHNSIKRFKFRAIIGAANNQLKATSKQREIELARDLAEREILFVIDWVHNVGGVIAGWAEYIFQENASLEIIEPLIEDICINEFQKLLQEAGATGRTPTEVAYDRIEQVLYQTPLSVKVTNVEDRISYVRV